MPNLARYNLVVTKDKSGSDNAQVPAAATVDYYKQGATVAVGTTVPNGATGVSITVRNTGRISAGDVLRNNLTGFPTVLVTSVTNPTTLVVNSSGNGAFTVVLGDRLVVTNNRPTPYKESTGVDAYGGFQSSTNATTGVLDPTYLKEPFFDAQVTGSGVANRLLTDQVGGIEHAIYDARDYASVQAALDVIAATGQGATLLLPPGLLNEFTIPAFTGVVVRSPNVTIRGERTSTLALAGAGYNNTDMIRIESGGFNLEDVDLLGPGIAGSGVAIRDIGKTPSGTNRAIVGHSFRRVGIHGTPSWGIELVPTTGTGGIWDIDFIDVTVYDALSGGSLKVGDPAESTVQISCLNCDFNGPGYGTYGTGGAMTRGAVHLINATSVAFYNTFFQPQNFSTSLSIDAGNNIHVQDAHFESGTTLGDVSQYWITTAGLVQRLVVESCSWHNAAHTGGPRLLKTDANGSMLDAVIRDCTLNHHEAVLSTDDIVLGNTSDGILLSNNRLMDFFSGVQREITYSPLAQAGVALVMGQAPAWQLRIPGISGTNVVTRPTDGAMIYDSTAHKLTLYESTVWKPVTTGFQVLAKSADQSNSTTSGNDISDLTVALAANEVIHFHAYLVASANAATTGIQLAVNGPASPSQVDATVTGWTAPATLVTTGVNAYETYQANTASAGATRRVFEIIGRVINGGTAGTFALRFKSEVTLNAVTVHRGSWLQYFKGTN